MIDERQIKGKERRKDRTMDEMKIERKMKEEKIGG